MEVFKDSRSQGFEGSRSQGTFLVLIQNNKIISLTYRGGLTNSTTLQNGTIHGTYIDAGWSSLVARRAHNPKVIGSNPVPATK